MRSTPGGGGSGGGIVSVLGTRVRARTVICGAPGAPVGPFAPAAVVALAILGEPVGSSLIAALFLDEIPSFFEIGAGAVILLGVYIGVRGGAISAN